MGGERGRRSFLRENEERAPVGSVEAQRMLEQGVAELAVQLEAALGVFLKRVREADE